MTKKEVIQKVEEKLGMLSTEIVDVINFAYEAGCIEEAIKYESKAKKTTCTKCGSLNIEWEPLNTMAGCVPDSMFWGYHCKACNHSFRIYTGGKGE